VIVVIIDTPEIPKAIDGENRLDIAPKKNPPNGVKPKVIPYSPRTRPRISSVHNNCNKDPIEASYNIKKAPIINERMKDNIIKSVKTNTVSDTPTQSALNNNKCGLYLKSPRDATNIVLKVEPKAFAADKYPKPWAFNPNISFAIIGNIIKNENPKSSIKVLIDNNNKIDLSFHEYLIPSLRDFQKESFLEIDS